MTDRLKAHIALFISAMIFAVNYWVSDDLAGHIGAIPLVFFRTIGAAFLFSMLLFFDNERKMPTIRDLSILALAALLGILINPVLFFSGLKYTTAVDTATIHTINPIMVMVLSAIFLKTKIKGNKIIGVFLGAIGAAVLVLYQKELNFGSDVVIGNIMIFGNTLVYALFLIILKPLLNRYSSITAMFWVYIMATIIFIPVSINQMIHFNYAEVFSQYGWSIFYIVFMLTFVAYLLNTYGLKRLSPTSVSFYVYLQPVFAYIIAIFLGEQIPSIIKTVATLLIILGVFLVNQEKKPSIN